MMTWLAVALGMVVIAMAGAVGVVSSRRDQTALAIGAGLIGSGSLIYAHFRPSGLATITGLIGLMVFVQALRILLLTRRKL